MAEFCLFRCPSIDGREVRLTMAKTSSTKRSYKRGRSFMVTIAFRSKFSMKILATIGETGDPIARPSVLL